MAMEKQCYNCLHCITVFERGGKIKRFCMLAKTWFTDAEASDLVCWYWRHFNDDIHDDDTEEPGE